MNNYSRYSYIAESIKDNVSMPDAIAFYAPSPAPRYNRIPCPIHNGKNYNLSFSDRLFHCFKCGVGGDVILFVQHIFGLNFKDAIEKINADFGLALPITRHPTLREQRAAKKRHEQRLKELAAQEIEKAIHMARYNYLWDEYARLDKIIMERAPRSPDDDIDEEYAEALKRREYVSYLIDIRL